MATSGTVTYRPTAATVISQALTIVGAIDPDAGGSPSATQSSDALTTLNMLAKTWEAKGLQLWETQYGVIFPAPSQSVFVLGSPGPAGDHACVSSPLGFGFVQTALDANAASGATSISVDTLSSPSTVGTSATTMANGYYIGIQLDSGDIQWTTINGSPVVSAVPLTTALTGAASSGNFVYCYQTKLVRPLRILDGFLRQVAGEQNSTTQNDVPCIILSREQYNRFGMKASGGTPIQLYYDPQENTGHLYMYPTFSVANQLMFIQYQSPIEDFATTSDDFDLPQEWGEALTWNLALRLCAKYEVSKVKYDMIKEMAVTLFSQLDAWDQEAASVFIQPQMWPYSQGK